MARPKPAERFEPAPASHEPIVVRPRILLAPTTLDVGRPASAPWTRRPPVIASFVRSASSPVAHPRAFRRPFIM